MERQRLNVRHGSIHRKKRTVNRAIGYFFTCCILIIYIVWTGTVIMVTRNPDSGIVNKKVSHHRAEQNLKNKPLKLRADKKRNISSRNAIHHTTRKQIDNNSKHKQFSLLPTLADILKQFKSKRFYTHHYDNYYTKWLEEFRQKKKLKMLEIGVHEEDSLSVWRKYFTDPYLILGFVHSEVSKEVKVKINSLDAVKIISGDQSDKGTLERVCNMGPYDIIIDDGSHVPQHQVFSFAYLWNCLQSGGLYVVEGLETSYWNKNKKVNGDILERVGIGESPKTNAVEKFKQLIDVLMRYQLGYFDLSIIPGDDEICSITFGMNLVSFHKCSEAEKWNTPMFGPHGTVIDHDHMTTYVKRARETNPDGIAQTFPSWTKNTEEQTDIPEDNSNALFSTFEDILDRSGSDKFYIHHYENYYTAWLEPFRHKEKLKMLEIGAFTGKSLSVWQEYFTNPDLILGLAYGVNMTELEHEVLGMDAVEVISGDQSDPEVLNELCKKGPFDVIIDDGSHVPQHQVFSFTRLWNCLSSGGIYIVEDLETNYWNEKRGIYGYFLEGVGIGESPKTNAVEKFKQLIDVLMRYQMNFSDLSIIPGDDEICSITFGMNLVSFQKCTEAETRNRPLRGPYGNVVDHSHMKVYIERARATNQNNAPIVPMIPPDTEIILPNDGFWGDETEISGTEYQRVDDIWGAEEETEATFSY